MEISDRGKAELEIMGQISERREREWGKERVEGGKEEQQKESKEQRKNYRK